ncbi:MAG: hypothetical protein AB1830_12980 [Pseudomonadota bacterium]
MKGPTHAEIQAKRLDLIDDWMERLDDVSEVVSALIACDGYSERKLLHALAQDDRDEAGHWLAKIVRAYAEKATAAELQDWLEHGYWAEQRAQQEDDAYERWRQERLDVHS